MPIHERYKPSPRPDWRLEQMDEELLLFQPAEGRVLYCNQTAGLVWRLCDGERTVGEIVALLAEAYPEAGDALPADVARALQAFADADAILLA